MELVDRVDIQKYAKRNTSPNIPIEAKYVQAFVDALMNSTKIQDVYDFLRAEMQNGDSYVIFNSYGINARNINKEPYRSIIAYAMLKKDIHLFELISASMFTGSIQEYHGSDLYSEFTRNTDESPIRYTDEGTYTDMNEGLVQIGFKNYFCDEPLPDGTGSEYQTIAELQKALTDFDYIITLTKPARVEVLLFYIPWCYLSGDDKNIVSCNIYRPEIKDGSRFSCPFGDELSMNILSNMSDYELIECYSHVSMYDYVHGIDRDISVEKKSIIENDAVICDYTFRCQSSSKEDDTYIKVTPVGDENPSELNWYEYDSLELKYTLTSDITVVEGKMYYKKVKDSIWGSIKLLSNTGSKTYAESKSYKDGEEYYEKYIPIMLRLRDNDPTSPCIAFEIDNGTPTVGALFYTRERRQ